METRIRKPDEKSEFLTPERCWIQEIWNDPSDTHASIARARVRPGVTTQLHRLREVAERYLVVSGSGLVEVDKLPPDRVQTGDVVVIPAGTPQRITNVGDTDLVFYCICTPRFSPNCYEALE
jgi:mannose-6-phosphate isomerase-like protein (cupin superfamily)